MSLVAVLLAAPFINVLAVLGGARWLAAYGVVAAMGGGAAALAVALTIALFRLIGAKRTRLIAQIVAAVIGAAFVIGLQIAAIFSSGSLSRFARAAIGVDAGARARHGSAFWWPARAVLGDLARACAVVMAASLALLGVAIAVFSRRFGDHAVAAAGVSQSSRAPAPLAQGFRRRSPSRVLRHKEWTLLRARSLAGVADADADPLSAAAGAAAVASAFATAPAPSSCWCRWW